MRTPGVPVRRVYRFRLAGVLYLSVTAFLAVAAISSQNNLLFWCLGLATAGIAVSGVVSGAGLVGLRVEREAIPDSTEGGVCRVRYRVRNVNRFVPAFGLLIGEREPPRRRRVSHPWHEHVRRPVAFVSAIGPRQTVVAEARTRAVKRGEPEFTDFFVSSSFPFGLATKTLRFTQSRTGLVWPRPISIDPRLLGSSGTGRERARARNRHGATAGEFFGLREYVAGDPLRSIAWRPSARLGQWVVSQHAEPSPSLVWIMLEIPEGTPDDLAERTLGLAAGVVRLAGDRGLAFGLCAHRLGISLPPARGRAAIARAMRALAKVTPDGGDAAPTHAPLRGPGPRDLVVRVAPTGAASTGPGRRLIAEHVAPAGDAALEGALA